MKLKRLLSLSVLLLVLSGLAAAAVSQLSEVGVAVQGASTTVTLRLNGAASHNEYRPDDKTLLVDLPGVASNALRDKQKSFDSAALKSYRVMSYGGSDGREVTRIELSLGDAVSVNVSDNGGEVRLQLKSAKAVAAAPPVSAEPQAAAAPTVAAAHAESAETLSIHDVSLRRDASGVTLNIQGASQAKALMLDGPDRLVLDFAGAVPNLKSKNLFFNSDEVKGVRVARYQLTPPVTRVVIDLNKSCDYTLEPGAGALTVRIQSRATAVAASKPAVERPAVEPSTPVVKSEPVVASNKIPVELAKPAPAKSSEPVLIASTNPSSLSMPRAASDESKSENTPSTNEVKSLGAIVDSKPADDSKLVARNVAKTTLSFSPAVNLAQEQALSGPSTTQTVKSQYTGEAVSINVKDADLRDFFRLVHEVSGLNVVLDPGVRGTVTMVLDDVPWDQALDIVLRNNGLQSTLTGNILRIASTDTLRREAEALRAQQQAAMQVAPRVTVTRYLSYAKAKQVEGTIHHMLSVRGEMISDDRINALIITDISDSIADIDKLLLQLDRKTQQIQLSARVVSATRKFEEDFGVGFGFIGNAGTTSIGGSPSIGTNTVKGYGSGSSSSKSYDIPIFSNMTMAANSGLNLVTKIGNFDLDMALSMMESRGLAKILSRPLVMAQNNSTAMIEQGVQIPVVTKSELSGPSTTTMIDAMLKLSVTPQITAENTIFLDIQIENSTPDNTFVATTGQYGIDTQKMQTKVLVRDGETAKIGGVIKTSNNVSESHVPILGSIPYLGNLFRKRQVSTETDELIFFITPKIMPI